MRSNFKRSTQKFHIKMLMILNNPFVTDKVLNFGILSSFLWNSEHKNIKKKQAVKFQMLLIHIQWRVISTLYCYMGLMPPHPTLTLLF